MKSGFPGKSKIFLGAEGVRCRKFRVSEGIERVRLLVQPAPACYNEANLFRLVVNG